MKQRTLGGVVACVAVLAGGCVGERPSDAGQWTNPPRNQPPGSQPATGNPNSTNTAAPTPEAQGAAMAAQVEQDMAELQATMEEREVARAAAAADQVSRAESVRQDRAPSEQRAPASGSASVVIDGEGGTASANVEESIETGDSAGATMELTIENVTPMAEASAPGASLQDQIESLRVQLAEKLEAAAVSGEGEARALLALGALETLRDGALRDEVMAHVGEEESSALRAWAAMHREAARRAEAGETGAGIAAAGVAAAGASENMFRVETALLCAKVEGFGRYQTLDSSALLAGRGHRAIVYIEVTDFAHRAMTNDRGDAGWNVELTQELSLYHDADQVLAWRRPEQTISDFSRNKRRDFFVVQMVELPSTLSIGAYNLKVTMRDREAGAVAEAIIPIRVVADAALTRGGR